MLFYKKMESPIGGLTLVADENSLKRVLFMDEVLNVKAEAREDNKILNQALDELNEYFNGNLKEFKVKTDPDGTKFQKKCWDVLKTIEYGSTISYEDEAISLGDKKKTRACGNANSRNPIPIIIPCHRVIGKDGNLTGYAGGLHIKKYLLDLEREHYDL
ncbi:MAG: methylated-DNA--[protein]-cysteine S-methyltransferase [Oscillospiraceae bacterium]|nr:methylated-DNA--[protein]-cysteine S-methyltransferase [Oscillospiraceae bacterium]